MRLFWLLLLALAGTVALPAQGRLRVSPEAAADHLLRKIEPLYPAFARAAGFEGVVRIEVGIATYGRIDNIGAVSGPPALQDAAMQTILKYVYRPFEQDGHPVNVATTVEVRFSLGAGPRKAPAYPAQKISMDDFTYAATADAVKNVSAKFRAWLRSYAKSCGGAISWMSAAEQATKSKDCLDSAKVLSLPVKKAGVRLYFVELETRETCGATGNCSVQLVEEDATGVHAIAGESGGWGFHARFRPGSLYPDIFIPWHMSGREQAIVGYANLAGHWGVLYCGSIQTDQGKGTAEIQVCR